MSIALYDKIKLVKQHGGKQFAVLIDPDKIKIGHLEKVIENAIEADVDYIFVGGSLIVHDMMDYCLRTLKETSNLPVILFPGNPNQINHRADAILYLSLISGRNPDLLIGNHVLSAAMLKSSPLEVIPTGYMLIDGGITTTALYISNTHPIPANKPDIAASTAMAGELLGLKMIYMDAGSGAKEPISEKMIQAVSTHIDIPLIIGGGIKTPELAQKAVHAGADLIVVGNAIEKDPALIKEIADVVHNFRLF